MTEKEDSNNVTLLDYKDELVTKHDETSHKHAICTSLL